MLKEKLQHYFDGKGNSKIENISSIRNIFSQVTELADDFESGTAERANHSALRAIEIFQKLFKSKESEVFVLIYEFAEPNSFDAPNEYLHFQFQNNIEKQILDIEDCKIYIYKAKLKNIEWKNILNAIANAELGFKPAIDQKIYFFDVEKNIDFYMYDDRGCLSNGL